GQEPKPVLDGAAEHRGVDETWQVVVLCEVLPDLTDGDVVPAPKRNVVQFPAEARPGEECDQEVFTAESLARAYRKSFFARQADGLPFYGSLRRVLDRYQEPLIRLWQAPRHSAVDRGFLRLRLLHLVRREVERDSLG